MRMQHGSDSQIEHNRSHDSAEFHFNLFCLFRPIDKEADDFKCLLDVATDALSNVDCMNRILLCRRIFFTRALLLNCRM
jgi:hypothetical protein